MVGTSIIEKYFPNLSSTQVDQFKSLEPLYTEWNEKINVISRKDMDSFYERHVLHSLAIAKVYSFLPGMKVLDVGTGGGFPGIPLAILFPEVHFTLIDSIGKKIKVVEGVAEALELSNVTAMQIRAEQVNDKFDFIISRAVTQMPKFLTWVRAKIKKAPQKEGLKNGLLYLKGGDLTEELATIPSYKLFELSDFFTEEFFETKKVVYIRLR
tara:strand:- start:279 stop:911 length:633 start_codon:yes stop_codon:yes gene_type:complete